MPSISGFGGGSLTGGINAIGSAVGDLYAAEGDQAEAANYEQAAGLSREEAKFTESSTNISEMQATRQITQSIGGVKAAYGASGLAQSGSALDVLGSSAQQGSLTKSAIGYQGLQQEYQYQEQAVSYDNMAAAAENAAQGSDVAAGISGLSAIANFATLGLFPK
jgi:hypothetical protein